MISFFKSLGRGILYVVGLPFLLAFVAIYAVFSFFIIAFMFFKAVVLFFMGSSLFDELEEDKKAKEVLANIANRNQPVAPNYVGNAPMNQAMPQSNNYQPQNAYVSQNNNPEQNIQNNNYNQPQNYQNQAYNEPQNYQSNNYNQTQNLQNEVHDEPHVQDAYRKPIENNQSLNNFEQDVQIHEQDDSTVINIKAGDDEDE